MVPQARVAVRTLLPGGALYESLGAQVHLLRPGLHFAHADLAVNPAEGWDPEVSEPGALVFPRMVFGSYSLVLHHWSSDEEYVVGWRDGVDIAAARVETQLDVRKPDWELDLAVGGGEPDRLASVELWSGAGLPLHRAEARVPYGEGVKPVLRVRLRTDRRLLDPGAHVYVRTYDNRLAAWAPLAPRDTGEMWMDFASAAAIAGYVRGSIPWAAQVVLLRDGVRIHVPVGPRGRFEARGLAPGAYAIEVWVADRIGWLKVFGPRLGVMAGVTDLELDLSGS